MGKSARNQRIASFLLAALAFFGTAGIVFASDYVPSAKLQEINALLDDNYRVLANRSIPTELGPGAASKSTKESSEENSAKPVSGDSWNSKDALDSRMQDFSRLSSSEGTPPPPNPDDIVSDATREESPRKKDELLPGGRVKMSGRYRLAAGMNGEDFILNDSNGDLQERNFRYISGERLNNTFDPGIYSQYLLNVDFTPADKFDLYTQIVMDPWSWVGTTGEQVIRDNTGTSTIRPNLKYFGSFNGVLNEIYRSTTGDSLATPLTKVIDGHTTRFTAPGFTDFGTRYTFPDLDVDYELRPIRKLWMDYTEDQWHLRAFALADQNQALTTDDPLELSNHKQYWQQSPWLYEYKPIQFFSDRSIKRGYYSDTLSFLAKDSEGNRLVLLRGGSIEVDLGKTYIAATVAAPFTPWDDGFFNANNVPGAVRIKHKISDKMMGGGTYTFRTGLINNSVADLNQVVGIDAKYEINKGTSLSGEIAGSQRDRELMTNDRLKTDMDGYAYKAVLDTNFEHAKYDGHTDFSLSYTQMDKDFSPNLSRYTNTRDDIFWGKHIAFQPRPDLESFRIGDGVDINRFVVRARWREKMFKDRFVNLTDIRNVHRTSNTAYLETVARDEMTYKVTPKLTTKGLFRWQGLPKTSPHLEPFISNFYYSGDLVDPSDPTFNVQNVAVQADKDPSRFTYSGGLQYFLNKQWTAEGIYERSNDIPDFPRGLLFDTFRDANARVDGLLLDHVQGFYYGQTSFGLPPYKYFNIIRERLIYKPEHPMTITIHAAQNSYKFAGGIDDNINHQGVSIAFDVSKKLSLFFDFTHSMQIDVPKLIATNYVVSDFTDHYNFYTSMDYKINSAMVFRTEYGVFGLSTGASNFTPYTATALSLPTIDTEHLFRVSLTGDF